MALIPPWIAIYLVSRIHINFLISKCLKKYQYFSSIAEKANDLTYFLLITFEKQTPNPATSSMILLEKEHYRVLESTDYDRS